MSKKCFNTLFSEAQEAVESVSPDQAHELWEAGRVLIVDPRDAESASATGRIPGALHLGLAQITEDSLPKALGDRSRRIIAACQAGPMGAIAAHELLKLGFTEVSYLAGGTQGWLDAGYSTSSV